MHISITKTFYGTAIVLFIWLDKVQYLDYSIVFKQYNEINYQNSIIGQCQIDFE